MWWYSNCGRIGLQMTLEQARSASHQGQCAEDVKALSQVPKIARQLVKLDPEIVRYDLGEFGAWDETDLSDHEENLQRLLWIAACDIREDAEQSKRKR